MIVEKVEASSSEGEENYRLIRAMDGNVSISIDPAALESLELMVRDSVNAIRGRGVEMGGLVLGRPMDRNSRKLVITGFVPVEIEYRFGPSFRTSSSDLETFHKSVAGARGTPIGYFRTQVRTGMLIRDDDLRLLDSLFGDRDCCFAPIEATVNSPSLLNLHLVAANRAPRLVARFPVKQARNGVIAGPELPLAAAPERESAIKSELRAKDELPPPAPLLEKTLAESGPPPAETRSNRRLILPLVAAGLTMAGAAFFLGNQYGSRTKVTPTQPAKVTQSSSTVPDAPLDLRIAAVQSVVEIRWNRNNLGVASASRGLLVLFDGPEPKRIELDPKQVRSGLYSLQARSTKISAWLTIYQANGSFIGETKEALLPLPSAVVIPYRERTPAPAQTSSKSGPGLTGPPAVRTDSPADPSSDPQLWVDRRPVPTPELVRVPDLPTPPPVASPSVLNFQPPSVPASDPKPPGLQYKGSVARAVPARLLHQVSPAVPAEVAAKLRTEVQLDVSVSIDPTGRVTGARVASSQGALASLLALEVLKAAQLCQFAPAQENGHAAAGSAILTFRFAPRSH